MSEGKLQGLVDNMSSEEYHSIRGVYSSSQLKDMLDDEEIFYKKYISKELEKEHIAAFDIGSYFHTAILEPDKMHQDCAVFRGIRRGKEWESFKLENKGKAIITESEENQALNLISAVKNSPIAMGRIKRGKAEVSGFMDVIISNGEVYSPDGQYIIGKYGWDRAKEKINKKSAVNIPLKVRADLLADDFILDLKSTSGNAKSEYKIKSKVSEYSYDLSAALYLDVFSMITGKMISEFIWTFASKDMMNCRSYIASQSNIQVGRAKWRKAVIKLASCIESDWAFEDYLAILEPQVFELEILKQRGEESLL